MSFAMIGVLGWMPNLFGMTGQRRRRFAHGSSGRADRVDGSGRKLAFTGAFVLSALSMAMPFVGSDYVALALMGLALFGNQWVAATYIGTVGDVVPHQLAGRVNGIAGFGDSASVLIAQLAIGCPGGPLLVHAGLHRGRDLPVAGAGERAGSCWGRLSAQSSVILTRSHWQQ